MLYFSLPEPRYTRCRQIRTTTSPLAALRKPPLTEERKVPGAIPSPEETGETGEYDKWGGENAYLGEHEISTISLFILGLGVLRVGARKIDGTRGAG